MNTVSYGWLRISPASCIRLSAEYIAGVKRAGRSSCSGSTTKLSAAAAATMSALAQSNRTMLFAALLIRT